MAVIVLVGMATQSCKIEMPSLVSIIADYEVYDFSKSKAIAVQGGFKDTLVIGDIPETRHGDLMHRIITSMVVSQDNLVFFNFGPYRLGGDIGLIMFVSDEWKDLREKTRIIHVPKNLPFARPQDAPRIASTDNILFVLAAGNNVYPSWKGNCDVYNIEHPRWSHSDPERDRRRKEGYKSLLATYSTGKVIAATSAAVTTAGTIEQHKLVASCGDIKESCFTVIPEQFTSDASARLSAMAFYLSQLYPTEEEVRETLEICAVDIGEPGIDREYGRGIANLLCPRVLEKEVDIVSQYLKERGEVFTPKAGGLTGSWEAKNIPLQVYIPVVLRETIQVQYQGTTNGTIRFSGENQVSADITLSAKVQAVFLLNIAATATDTVQVEGTYTAQESALTLEGENTSCAYTYTATENSLYLVRSLTMNEALALLPGSIGELSDTVTKDLLADDPIRIMARFARIPDTPGDFDRNGIVDFADFLLFVATYGAREGEPAYNSWMDFDKDGAITFSDFLIFTAAFGQTT